MFVPDAAPCDELECRTPSAWFYRSHSTDPAVKHLCEPHYLALLARDPLVAARCRPTSGPSELRGRVTQQAVAGQAREDGAGGLDGKRVLICEDEGYIGLIMNRMVTAAGMTVVGIARSGIEGVEIALRERPDLVLMDIDMPCSDGVEATRRICEAYPARVVMITGVTNKDVLRRAFAAGASGYLAKPFARDQLIPILQDALANAHSA